MNSKPKLVFAVNVDWFFLSHRLPLAMAAKQAGLEVYVLAEDTGKGEVIEQYGLKFIPFGFSTGNHMLQDLQLLSELTRLYKKIRPVLVHQVRSEERRVGKECRYGEGAVDGRQKWRGRGIDVQVSGA